MVETDTSVLAPLRWIGIAPPVDACLFLDRDGVLNERVAGGYVTAWAEFRWRPGAVRALQRFAGEARLPLVVVTNQACVGRGLASVETVVDIQERMRAELRDAGIELAAWYCCPHRPEDGCLCRKPLPGMLEACRRDLGVRLERSYLIGDTDGDVAAGAAAGCAAWKTETPDDLRTALDDIAIRERTKKEAPW